MCFVRETFTSYDPNGIGGQVAVAPADCRALASWRTAGRLVRSFPNALEGQVLGTWGLGQEQADHQPPSMACGALLRHHDIDDFVAMELGAPVASVNRSPALALRDQANST